jgi:methylenetetrahydrofolate dehydrogenase (NADP+) / methenyltetrahydrofolate cyclohydrolase / formyltetrahydrofolate synthetase
MFGAGPIRLLSRTMTSSLAKVIDGTAVAAYVHCLSHSCLLLNSVYSIRSLRKNIAEQIKATQRSFPRFQPQLAIVQAGDRPDSSVYVRMKSKAAQEVGIKFRHVTVPVESTAEEVVQIVKKLNGDDSIHGILVQLPLGDQVTPAGERLVTEAVNPEKDVDG